MKPAARLAAPLVAAALLAVTGCKRAPDTPVSIVFTTASAPLNTAPVQAGAVAAPPPASVPTNTQRQQGVALATQGNAHIASCGSCHGVQGEGNAGGGFPRLAGQSYAYLRHQLASYANDSRNHPVMAPIAKAMAPTQQEAAAAYYASLIGVRSAAASAPTAVDLRGQQLASLGDASKGLQACAHCHGVDGSGPVGAIPYLAGQPQAYLVSALVAWRDGRRRNDPSGQMQAIAQALNDADMQAVTNFYSQIPPPGTPRDAGIATGGAPAPAASTVAPPPSDTGQASAPQGLGNEQGATGATGDPASGVPVSRTREFDAASGPR